MRVDENDSDMVSLSKTIPIFISSDKVYCSVEVELSDLDDVKVTLICKEIV